jgi:hypothetical protein
MPRQSASDRQLSVAATPVARLRPPDDLDGPERALFCEIVLSVRPDHFSASDAIVLATFCRAVVLEKVASAELAAARYVDAEGRPSGWLNILTQAQRTVSTYSRLLRLNPVARSPAPMVQKEQHVSYYEKMSLEGRHGPADQN